MIWKCVAVCLVIILLVCPISAAVKDTFQDWENDQLSGGTVIDYDVSTSYMGKVVIRTSREGDIYTPRESFDYYGIGYECKYVASSPNLYLLDSAGNSLGQVILGTKCGYIEMKIIGMKPTYFRDGVQWSSGTALNVYPSYLRIRTHSSNYLDNLQVGGTDHHMVGAIPSNWSIQRDILNPLANGAYAWNPNTDTWVIKDSNNFYIEVVTSSVDDVYEENVFIKNWQYGGVVKVIPIDSTKPYHILTININEFLNDPNPLGIDMPDGMYRVYFESSPLIYEDFWVISNGAVVETAKDDYIIGESTIVSVTILESYYDTNTYDYYLRMTDEYGEQIGSDHQIISATHVDSLHFSESDGGGARFITAVAKNKSTGEERIIGYKVVTVLEYIGFYGVVYDGSSESPLEGATINITQSSPDLSVLGTSGYDGNYTITGFIQGSPITITATATGYVPYEYTFNPFSYGLKNVDITLVPVVTAHSGLGINGVIRDTVYGRPIGLSAVTISNATYGESYSDNANSVGYYQLDEDDGAVLTNLRWYDVVGSKLKYGSDAAFVQAVSE